MNIEITDRKNLGTNRKPRLAMKFTGDLGDVLEFSDCHDNRFRVGSIEKGWTRIKRLNGVRIHPGKGPYTPRIYGSTP